MSTRIDMLRSRLLRAEREREKLERRADSLRRTFEIEMRLSCGGGDLNQKAKSRSRRCTAKSSAAPKAVRPC